MSESVSRYIKTISQATTSPHCCVLKTTVCVCVCVWTGGEQAGAGRCDVPAGVQPGPVGGHALRDPQDHRGALPPRLLRHPALEHHPAPLRAALHLLPLPLRHLPLQDLVQRLPEGGQVPVDGQDWPVALWEKCKKRCPCC